jgi:hypothetical protein
MSLKPTQVVAYGIAVAAAVGALLVSQRPGGSVGSSRSPRDRATEVKETKAVLKDVARIQDKYRDKNGRYFSDDGVLAQELMKKRGWRIPSWIGFHRLEAEGGGWALQLKTPHYLCAVSGGMPNPVLVTAEDKQPECIDRPADLDRPVVTSQETVAPEEFPAPEDSVVEAKQWLRKLQIAQEAHFADSAAYTNDIRSLTLGRTDTSWLAPPPGYGEPELNASGNVWSARLVGTRYVCGIAIGNTENPVSANAVNGEPACIVRR